MNTNRQYIPRFSKLSRVLFLMLCFLTIINPCISFSKKYEHLPIVLSAEQKKEDIRWLFNLVKDYYPFTQAIVNEKGLANFFGFEEEYQKKSGNARNNSEFIQIVSELLQMLEQGTVHADLLEAVNLPPKCDTARLCIDNQISQASIKLNPYWLKLYNETNLNLRTNFEIEYKDGCYLNHDKIRIDGKTIPKGSKIIKIDQIDVHEYVKLLQHKIRLRFDPALKIPYSSQPSPLIGQIHEQNESWEVQFQTPAQRIVGCQVPKKEKSPGNTNLTVDKGHLLFRELGYNIAYIRLSSFPDVENAPFDLEKMAGFLSGRSVKYKKLIIDLRKNSGGMPRYGEKLLIEPFLKEAKEYVQYAAVKKTGYNRLIQDALKEKNNQEKENPNFNFGSIEVLPYAQLPEYIRNQNADNELFYYLSAKKIIEPNSLFQFEGKIFLLTDNDSFSSAEDIIRVYKELKIGTIVGARSGGGAAVALPSTIFELPNSHILFNLEIEMAFNSDGTINEIYGTRPDVELEPSTFPTSFPISFSTFDLLRDPWIQWIINK